MTKLSETHAVLLSTAAARVDLNVLPAPETLKVKGAALDRALNAMLRRGWLEELVVDDRRRTPSLKASDEQADLVRDLIVSPAGLAAIGLDGSAQKLNPADAPTEVGASERSASARPSGKLGVLLDAVSRPGGATIEDLTSALGWLPHTTRAALARLRQRGFDVRLASDGARKAYRLAAKA